MIWHLGSGITKNSEIKPLLQVSYRLLQNLVSFAKLKVKEQSFLSNNFIVLNHL